MLYYTEERDKLFNCVRVPTFILDLRSVHQPNIPRHIATTTTKSIAKGANGEEGAKI